MSTPCTSISPAVGSSSPSSMAMVVVLPAPLPPSSPSTAPGATAKVRSSTATTSPYTLRRCRTAMEGDWGMAALQRLDRRLDAIEAAAERLGARSEAKADIALAAGTEGFAGLQAVILVAWQLLAYDYSSM